MAETAHTEVPGAHGGFPPFQKETFASQIFWLVIFFVALYLVISRIAVPRIGGILEQRTNRIEGDFAEDRHLRPERTGHTFIHPLDRSRADATRRNLGQHFRQRHQVRHRAGGRRRRDDLVAVRQHLDPVLDPDGELLAAHRAAPAVL